MQEQKQTFLQTLINALQNKSVSHFVRPEPPKPSLDRVRFLEAIAANETSIVKGNKYTSSQPSGDPKLGKALGKYRVTEGELKTYAQRYLGQSITSKQFLASSTAQDNYVYNKAKMLSDKGYTPEQIADIHNKGFTNSSAPGTTTYQNPDYVNKFNANYNATPVSR